jgi:hypothetical protein
MALDVCYVPRVALQWFGTEAQAIPILVYHVRHFRLSAAGLPSIRDRSRYPGERAATSQYIFEEISSVVASV